MQERSAWTTDAEARQVARECCYITGPLTLPRLAVMLATNLVVILAPYRKSIQNPRSGDTNGTKFPSAWYQKYKDGTKVLQQGSFVNWLMETGYHPSTRQTATIDGVTANHWAEWWVKTTIQAINAENAQAEHAGSHPFKSIWFDSMGTFSADNAPGFWGTTNPGWNPSTNAAYTKTQWLAMVHWLGDVARNLVTGLTTINPEALFIGANGLRGVGGGSAAGDLPAHVDLAMTEGWLIKARPIGIYDQAAFESAAQMMLDCQLVEGKYAEPIENGISSGTNPWTAAEQTQARRFTAAVNFIVARGKITFEYGDDQGTPAHAETAKDPALYALDLGTPLAGWSPASITGHRVAVGTANGQAGATGLYARVYTGGIVIANRTNAAVSYKAEREYTLVASLQAPATPTYPVGTPITIPAGSGVFLTGTGGSGGGGGGGDGGGAPVLVTAPALVLQSGAAWTPGSVARATLAEWSGQVDSILVEWYQVDAAAADVLIGDPVRAQTYTPTLPPVLASDDFSDTQTATLANADLGGAWQYPLGTAANFAKTGGKGTVTQSTIGTVEATLPVAAADASGLVDLSWPNAATGGDRFQALVMRQQANGDLYRGQLQQKPTGEINMVLQKVTGGGVTVAPLGGQNTQLIAAYTPGMMIHVRGECEGSQVRVKFWTGSVEPAAWTFEATDTSIPTPGGWGVRHQRGSGNTNTGTQAAFDNFTVSQIGAAVFATSDDYTILTGDITRQLRVLATAKNAAGQASALSAPSPTVTTTPQPPRWVAPPAISGTFAVGEIVTITRGVADQALTTDELLVQYATPDPLGVSPPTGVTAIGAWSATLPTLFTITPDLLDKVTRVTERGTNTNGGPVQAWSSWSPAITPAIVDPGADPANTTPPSIVGQPIVGETLAYVPGVWAGADTVTHAFRRVTRNPDTGDPVATVIPGATGDTYQLTPEDDDVSIDVVEDATSSTGKTATIASQPTTRITRPEAPDPPRPPVVAVPHYTWVLAGRDGSVLAELSGAATDRTLTHAADQPLEASFSLSLSDPAALVIDEGWTRLKVYQDDVLVHHGKVWVVEEDTSSGTMRCVSFGQMKALELDHFDSYGVKGFTYRADRGYTSAKILAALIQRHNGQAGTSDAAELRVGDRRGVFPPKKRRFEGSQTLWDCVTTLLEAGDPITIVERPVEGDVHRLDYPEDAGSERVETISVVDVYHGDAGAESGVVLAYGTAEANLSTVTRTRDHGQRRTRSISVGAGIGKKFRKASVGNAQARGRYGTLEALESYPTIKSTDILEDRAAAQLDARPWVYTVTPSAGAPLLGRDYQIGDTVRLIIAHGPIQADFDVRVLAGTITIDSSGVPQASEITLGENATLVRRTRRGLYSARLAAIRDRLQALEAMTPDAFSEQDDNDQERVVVGEQEDGTHGLRVLDAAGRVVHDLTA